MCSDVTVTHLTGLPPRSQDDTCQRRWRTVPIFFGNFSRHPDSLQPTAAVERVIWCKWHLLSVRSTALTYERTHDSLGAHDGATQLPRRLVKAQSDNHMWQSTDRGGIIDTHTHSHHPSVSTAVCDSLGDIMGCVWLWLHCEWVCPEAHLRTWHHYKLPQQMSKWFKANVSFHYDAF